MVATPETRGNETASTLRKSLRRLVAATAILYVVLILAVIKFYIDGQNTKDALCTYRADLSSRLIQATDFLKKNPNGTKGIPAKTIIDTISNQQRALLSFKDLSCPEQPAATPTPTPTSETP